MTAPDPSRQSGNVVVMKYLATCTTLMTAVSNRIYGGSLDTPHGITAACKYIAFANNGGPGHPNVPMADERFTFHCFGTTQQEAHATFQSLFDATHRQGNKRVTLSAGHVALIRRFELESGPTDLPDAGTGWPRVVCAYRVAYYEGTFSA
jgi:hypothetical protein